MNYNVKNANKRKLKMMRYKVWLHFLVKERFNFFKESDVKYNTKLYYEAKGKLPNLDKPESFSEKLLYLKMHYRNPLITLCSDKYYVREYVKACGYENILKNTYYVGNDATKIPYDELPNKFFVKCNHMSGFNYALKKEEIEDRIEFGKFMNVVLKNNWYQHGREWNYKNIKSKIICEELLENKDGSELIDYKFYCFGGIPRYYMISLGELNHQVRNHKFDMDDNSIDYLFKKESSLQLNDVKIPSNIDEMKNIVAELCKPFPHVRVDLYNIDGRIVFGELTFFSNGGVVNVYDESFENTIGSWIPLENYSFDME